jgi:NAD(P)-dependent dehydrogenase (short-subunit alcohol dehydrogenase family)
VTRRGEVALVTGGARRIGRAIVERLAAEGYATAIHVRRISSEAEALAAAIQARGGRAALVVGELTDIAVAETLVGAAMRALGPVTLLINNASMFEPDDLESFTADSFDRHMAANLRAPLILARDMASALPSDRGGAIVNVLDQRVFKPTPLFFSYQLSKSALHSATHVMAQGLAPRIRVNAVAPGPTLANVRQGAEDFARQAAATPLGHGAAPAEIADAVLWLARAASVTGQTISVDGGQRLAWLTPDVAVIKE